MVARVRGGAHAVVEDAGRRRGAQVENALIQEPFGEGNCTRIEFLAQRHDPIVVLVDHVNARRGIGSLAHDVVHNGG